MTDKLLKPYARMKLRADRRNAKRRTGKTRWRPNLQELVLVKSQPVSDTVRGITSKFQRPFEGPFVIHRKLNPSIYELANARRKLRGIFSLEQLKPYLEEAPEAEEASKTTGIKASTSNRD
jgi:hypothetical protein